MGNGCVDAIMAVFKGERPNSVVNPDVYEG